MSENNGMVSVSAKDLASCTDDRVRETLLRIFEAQTKSIELENARVEGTLLPPAELKERLKWFADRACWSLYYILRDHFDNDAWAVSKAHQGWDWIHFYLTKITQGTFDPETIDRDMEIEMLRRERESFRAYEARRKRNKPEGGRNGFFNMDLESLRMPSAHDD